MQQNNLLMYLIVFAVVFVPYLFLSFFINKPEKRSVDFKLCNIPPLYRMTWGLISYFTESIGVFSEDLQPARKKKMQNALVVANIKMDTTYIFAAEILFCLIGSVAATLVAMTITMNGFILLLVALGFGFIGFVLPSMTVSSSADKRQSRIMKSLPFSIDLIGSAMRSGIDFTAAIRYYVATEKPDDPLALEFGIMLRQLELGKTRIEALEDMGKRVQHDAFDAFTAAVIHGMEVGASIVETMKIQAEEMRRVRFNAAERKAARAVSAMILPIAVFIMPAMFIIIGTPVLLKVFSSGLGGLMQ
jgi:pilus assembly protein TadC